jgi:hypothetical protein
MLLEVELKGITINHNPDKQRGKLLHAQLHQQMKMTAHNLRSALLQTPQRSWLSIGRGLTVPAPLGSLPGAKLTMTHASNSSLIL